MNTTSYRRSGSQVNRSASTNLTGAPPGTRLAAIASISGDASTAVTSLAWRSDWRVRTPGPQASSKHCPQAERVERVIQLGAAWKIKAPIKVFRGKDTVIGTLFGQELVLN